MGRPPTITRERLLDTARKVFATKGYDATTLADIAGELGVTPAALLRYARSKQALFAAAMRTRHVEMPPAIIHLQATGGAEDPRIVLRRLAEEFVPFVSKTIAENLAIYMHRRSQTSLVLPFDVRDDESPPRRGLAIVTDYFRRAAEAGVLRVKDPRASALLFMGSLQSYVLLHQVFNVASKPYPLDDYIDALLDLWTNGAIGGARARSQKTAAPPRRAARARGASGGPARLVARAKTAEGDRPLRNARSPHRRSGVAHRRPRRPRPRR
ncbi:MAG TPA: TetR/AcrR family transcriptional regulator [Thermoanaerobaculia bacterium]|nr:TetR/AcrR family transcriptional regulator [Thermoanaerobaculia bacterium]